MEDVVIHPTAIVDSGAAIGKGTRIWHWVHICSTAKIGTKCSLGQGVYIGNNVSIGNNVKIQNNVSVYDTVVLEDDVFCGPSMVFTNVINPRSQIVRKNEYRPTLVKKGASLGANCTIVCGYEIGKFAFVAAGAVVTGNVPDYALVGGVPARHMGWICECGIRLPVKLNSNSGSTPSIEPMTIASTQCKSCGLEYSIDGRSCKRK